MTALLQIRQNGQINLPAYILRQARLQKGDILQVFVENGIIHLIPQTLTDRSQAYFWTQHWQKGEQASETDLRNGRYKEFDEIEDLLSELEVEGG